jgi:hypothetical protein
LKILFLRNNKITVIMKTHQQVKIIRIITVFFLTGLIIMPLLFSGCKKDDSEGDAPQLLPEESFIIDFSDFDDGSDTLKSAKSTLACQNWGTAFLKVAGWNIVIAVSGAVPVTAFRESFNHQPVYEGKNTWAWSYNYTIGSATYSARLTGKILETEEVKWEMYITKSAAIGGYTNFKWYEGVARLDRTSGYWILYQSPDQNHELIQIDWNRNWDNNTGDIKYTNVVPGGAENGGYISYGVVDDPVFDAYYTIYNKGQDNLTGIQWNRTTKEGRIRDPRTFGDELWHCWDTLLADIVCP